MNNIFSLLAALLLSSEAAPQQKIGGNVRNKIEFILPGNQFADFKSADPQRYRDYISYTKTTGSL